MKNTDLPTREIRFFDDTPDLVDDADTWRLQESHFDAARERSIEALFSVSNGYLGTRGVVPEAHRGASSATLVAGLFNAIPGPAPIPRLVVAPDWTRVVLSIDGKPLLVDRGEILSHHRILDMRRGLFERRWRHRDPLGRITRVRTRRVVSLADRHALAEIVEVTPENYEATIRAESWVDGRVANAGGHVHLDPVQAAVDDAGTVLTMVTNGTDRLVSLAASGALEGVVAAEHHGQADTDRTCESWEWPARPGQTVTLHRYVAIYTSRESDDAPRAARDHRAQLVKGGMASLFAHHERAWSERWAACDIRIEGDAWAQRATRFALFHLIGHANPEDERVSIGARGLAGEGYGGHVFWDTEIFMVPFYTFTWPAAARALLSYRHHTLAGAREKARRMGYRGALYAWESADTGHEVTPPMVFIPGGGRIPILCGTQEQHISADVAYAIWHYWRATGDDDFMHGRGAEILLETARFWASRAEREEDGLCHIRGVIGPDEYHEEIDDSAYTNRMAAWNIDRALELVDHLRRHHPAVGERLSADLQLTDGELEQWGQVARSLAVGFDPVSGLLEQHDGYFGLDYLDLQEYEPRTRPMDVLLGREKTQASQVVKQADIVMLSHLLWDHYPATVHETNFRYYEPRTGHGSSLSPAIHAAVAARLGDRETAARYYRKAAEIDLADNMGNASSGLHTAALGGLWQAAVMGFMGMRPEEDGLRFDPHLPTGWTRLETPMQWQGRRLRVAYQAATGEFRITLEAGEPLPIRVADGPELRAASGESYRIVLGEDSGERWLAA